MYNKTDKDVSNNQQVVGTLDYLKKFRNRRNPTIQDADVIKNNNGLTESSINDLRNLDDATSFIKKIDNDVTQRWFFLAHALKKVRDEKLYEERYTSFKDYFSSELGYSKRMVYYFINLADNYPIDTEGKLLELGVKKLLEIAELPEEQRNEYVENNDILHMSATEIKRDIKERKKRSALSKVQQSETEFNDGEDSTFDIDMKDKLNSEFKCNTAVGISISSSELKEINLYIKKLKYFTELVENFKEEQENMLPVEKLTISNIYTQLIEIKEGNDKFLNLINNYKAQY